MTASKVIHVVAAVIERPDGSFLLGQRGPGSFYPGYWEFPGGKIEAGESAFSALCRELDEELGIRVLKAHPWLYREHRYEHGHVKLHFFRVKEWTGELQNHVHSALAWQIPATQQRMEPMLPANGPILAALNLPALYGITHAHEIGIEDQLKALSAALRNGLRLVQIREASLDTEKRTRFARAAAQMCRQHGAQVLINGDLDLAQNIGADGIHLPSTLLRDISERPNFPLVAASCHNRDELGLAIQLGCDFVVLGPVKNSLSHPATPGMGWEQFSKYLSLTSIPIFALGGLDCADLEQAQQYGAHGIAAIRAAWR